MTKTLTAQQKKDDYIKEFLAKLEKHLKSDLYVSNKCKIVIAVSGGVDSVVLLDSLFLLSEELGFKLYIAHFNHQLRPVTSDEDEKFVKNLAKLYNIEIHTSKADVKKHSHDKGLSVEQSARELRYYFLEHVSRTLQANYLVTAHTKDDSVETFFLNLFRGSGLTGLSGIPKRRCISKNLCIIRPFLIFTKNELIEYAMKRELEWREDESNFSIDYTRNKIRNDLIVKIKKEYCPPLTDVIERSMKLIGGADKFIKEHIDHFLNNTLEKKQKDKFSLKIPVLNTFDDFIQGEIIQRAIMDIFKQNPIPLKIVDSVIGLIKKQSGSIIQINKNLIAVKDRENLLFYLNKSPKVVDIAITKEGEFDIGDFIIVLKKVPKRKVQLTDNLNKEFLDYDLLPMTLKVRNIEPTDRFQPLGMSEDVNITNFLTNQKIPLLDKQDTLVLAVKSEIIWILGLRISEKYKITDKTLNYLKAEIIWKNRKD